MTVPNPSPSLADLAGNAINQLGKLIDNEIQLARAEISQKIAQATTGMALLGAGAVVFIPALGVAMIGLAQILVERGFSASYAYLAVAAAGGLISAILALIGINFLKAESLKLKVTLQQFDRDVEAVKDIVR